MRKSPESSRSNGSRVINIEKESGQSMDLNQIFQALNPDGHGNSGDTRASKVRESLDHPAINEADYYSPNFAAITANAAARYSIKSD